MAEDQDDDGQDMRGPRIVFALYLLVIVAGVSLYVVVGLTHQ